MVGLRPLKFLRPSDMSGARGRTRVHNICHTATATEWLCSLRRLRPAAARHPVPPLPPVVKGGLGVGVGRGRGRGV